MFYYFFRDEFKPVVSLPWFGDPEDFPVFFGITLFAFGAITVVLPVENRMRNPHEMLGRCGVLNKSMILVTLMYSAMGGLGYLKYGDDVEDMITNNLPIEEVTAQIILGSFSAGVLFSYAIHFYVIMDIVRTNLLEERWSGNSLRVMEFIAISVINMIIFGLAATFPRINLLVSLVGAVLMTAHSIMLPALIDTASNWDDLGLFKWKAIKNGIIFVFGLVSCIIATISTVKKMTIFFTNK